MAGITPSQFRLSPYILGELDALAANNSAERGERTTALREIIVLARVLVEAAGRENADALDTAEWTLLGHTGDPADNEVFGEDPTPRDWSHTIALSLAQLHEGRPLLLASQREEQKAAQRLAKKISKWGVLRGYALMCALRYFWRHQEAGIMSCAAPEIWLTPTAK